MPATFTGESFSQLEAAQRFSVTALPMQAIFDCEAQMRGRRDSCRFESRDNSPHIPSGKARKPGPCFLGFEDSWPVHSLCAPYRLVRDGSKA